MKYRLKSIIILAIVIIFTMALYYFFNNTFYNLVILDEDNKVLKKFDDFDIDDYFTIEFIHSVNKTPVKDYYRINRLKRIINYMTIYYDYGAGVETQLENGETLTHGIDNSMIVSNINKSFKELNMYISTVNDHIFTINDNYIFNLTNLIGKNKYIKIKIFSKFNLFDNIHKYKIGE